MESIPRASGIYKFTCIPTGGVYVGSAINLNRRHQSHVTELRGNRHANSYFQRTWNKYGEAAFRFDVIELVLESFLLEREQYWIDRLGACDRKRGFNILPKAGSRLGHVASEETRRKLSIVRTGRKRPPHECAAIRERTSRDWIVVDPSGIRYQVSGLKEFCHEHGLSYGGMRLVAKGKALSSSGWRCWSAESQPPVFLPKIKGKRKSYGKEYILTPPSGEPITICDLKTFCRENSLGYRNMTKVADGDRPHHKGWRCQRKEDNGPPIVRELVAGEVVEVDAWYSNNRVHFANGEGFGDLSDLEAIS